MKNALFVIWCLAAFQASARAGSLIGCCSTAPTWASRRRGPSTAGIRWRKPHQVRLSAWSLALLALDSVCLCCLSKGLWLRKWEVPREIHESEACSRCRGRAERFNSASVVIIVIKVRRETSLLESLWVVVQSCGWGDEEKLKSLKLQPHWSQQEGDCRETLLPAVSSRTVNETAPGGVCVWYSDVQCVWCLHPQKKPLAEDSCSVKWIWGQWRWRRDAVCRSNLESGAPGFGLLTNVY